MIGSCCRCPPPAPDPVSSLSVYIQFIVVSPGTHHGPMKDLLISLAVRLGYISNEVPQSFCIA